VKRARRVAVATLLVLVLLPAWVLATESGLRFGLAVAGRLSGGAFSVREAHGRLTGDVSVGGVVVATRAATVSVEHAALNLRLTRLLMGRVQAEWLNVKQLTVAVHERPAAPDGERKPLNVEAPLRLAVEEGRLDDFRLQLPRRREWRMPGARFAARWRGPWIVLARMQARTLEAGPVEMRGRLALVDDLLQFEDFEVTQPSPVRIEGVLALTAREESALRLSWQNLRWPRQDVLGWLHSPRGTLSLEGPWQRYAWRMDARTVTADIAGELAARGHGDLGALAIEDARLKALQGVVSGTGEVTWTGGVGTDLELRWQGLDPSSRFAEWPGRLNGGATLQARWQQGQPQVTFDGRLDDSQLRGYALALHARGHTEQGAIHLQELTAQSGASQLRAAGQLWPRMALDGNLKSTDLRSLWAGLAGAGEAQFGVQGEMDALRFRVRASATAPRYRQVRARALALDANVGFKGHSELTLQVDELHAGAAVERLLLSGAGTRESHRATLALGGAQGAVQLAFAGGERGGVWSGQLADATLTPAQEAPWRLEEPADLSVRLVALRLEPACFGNDRSRACFDLELTPAQQRVAFRLREFALTHLRAWLPPDWTVAGTLSGTSSVQVRDGELAALNVDLDGSAGAVEGDGVRLDYGAGQLRVQPEDGRLHGVLRLTPAGGTVNGEVWISAGGALLDRPMLGDLKVNLPDLSFLPVLSPEIAAAQGSIDAAFNVSGTLRGPALDGRLQVADGRVRLATPGIELTDLSAAFDRGRDAPLKAHLSASSGEGQFTLDGELRAMQPKLDGVFTLKGEQVLGFNTPELRAWISPDLTLLLDGTRAKLTGTVTVPRAEITPREISGGGVAPSADQEIVAHGSRPDARGMKVESEVRVVLGERVRFDGLGLRTRLEGSLTAYDQPDRPTTGRGELRLVGGRYKAYGQDLQIETGRLLFNGGPITAPSIDLQAFREFPNSETTDVSKVGLRARGTLEAPEFSLYAESTRPLSQEEQLSWLVLGRPLSSATTTGQTGQLDQARASLGLAGGDFLAQQLAPRLRLDEVSVGARPGETADLARLTIGKYLSPKLFVSYGVGLFQPGHFFRMQYDLSKRFKLVGESGLVQGGDLLYTIESGGKKPPEKKPEK